MLQQRVAALEAQLGLDSHDKPSESLAERLKKLENTKESQEYRKLVHKAQSLSAGSAVSHQSQIVAPLLYRQQEILATVDDFKKSMALLSEMAQLLRLDDDKKSIENSPLLETPQFSDDHIKRLQAVQESLQKSQEQTIEMQDKLNAALVDSYPATLLDLSEKLVVLQDLIEQKTKS